MVERLLLCAPASGCGKTTVVCALLQALVNRGADPLAFKSGPDYIDPMFHSQIIGAESCNLDLFLMGRNGVLSSLKRHGEGRLCLLEGAMGYYDGIAMSSHASAYDLAKVTKTPAVLVIDGRGAALSLAATVAGFANFYPESMVRGVILNRVSPMLYPRLKDTIEEHTGVQVYGFLPPCPEATLESRHLGLVTAQEVVNLQEKTGKLGTLAERYLDIEGLLNLTKGAPEVPGFPEQPVVSLGAGVRIGVAKDRAFCFYYADALELLERLGAELVYFSPMKDKELPDNLCGLYLGGGYPELYGAALSQNVSMRKSVYDAIARGMPTIAECGGFLYLHETLQDGDGAVHPMVGIIPGAATPTGKLSQFGYVNLSAKSDGLLCEKGEILPAHEFHYWKSDSQGGDFRADKPLSTRGWDCGHHTNTLYAGFPHIHMGGCPEAAERFVKACLYYQRSIVR